MQKKDCIFCRIAQGEAEASVIYEDEACMAFLDTQPIARGHVLVIPKEHYVDIFEIEPGELEKLILASRMVAFRLRDRLQADGVNLFHRSGEAAEQTVFHFHIHVIPRKKGDRIQFNEWWATKAISSDKARLEQLASELRHT